MRPLRQIALPIFAVCLITLPAVGQNTVSTQTLNSSGLVVQQFDTSQGLLQGTTSTFISNSGTTGLSSGGTGGTTIFSPTAGSISVAPQNAHNHSLTVSLGSVLGQSLGTLNQTVVPVTAPFTFSPFSKGPGSTLVTVSISTHSHPVQSANRSVSFSSVSQLESIAASTNAATGFSNSVSTSPNSAGFAISVNGQPVGGVTVTANPHSFAPTYQTQTVHSYIPSSSTLVASASLYHDGEIAAIDTTSGTVSLAMNGHTLVTGALTGTGSLSLDDGVLVLDVDGSSVFEGAIVGDGSLVKQGAGVVTLGGSGLASNNSTYTGLTTVSEGTLILAKAPSQANAIGGDVVVSGGTLALGASHQINSGAEVSVQSGQFSVGGYAEVISGLDNSGGVVSLDAGGHLTATNGVANGGLIEIATGGTVTAAFVDNQGTLINDGTINAAVTATNGGIVGGTGTFSDLTIGDGGFADPGASPGTMNSTLTAWNSGGTYLWEINSLSGTAGADSGWDLWNTGTLTIGATDLDPFIISLNTLDSGNNAGLLGSWSASSDYSWLIATSTNGAFASLTGLFLDFSGFLNPLSGGFFSLVSGAGGNELYVNFTAASGPSPVPEPSSLVLLGCAAGGLFAGYRRRKRAIGGAGADAGTALPVNAKA